MQRSITEVDLKKIIPSATNPRKYFNETKLDELAASLTKTKGVIQAITLRPHPTKKDLFELVCGERRYRASGIAGFKTISAEIKNLSDDETEEIQFIENLERDDVHPMDEAVTFQAMRTRKTKSYSVADIAAKINKPETYVIQRLQLVNLIPAFQKEFWDEKFLIGHAIQFARLTPADQKSCFESKRNGLYGSVNDAKDFIERNIMQHLSAAPFDKKDTNLVPAAGACINCPKRSGCNTLLFQDIKQDDRCFDKKCFTAKTVAHGLIQLEKTILEKPDVLIMKSYEAPIPAYLNLVKKHGVTVKSTNDNDIHYYKDRNHVEVKCFMISGNDTGKIKTYWKTSNSKALAAAAAKSGSPVKISAAVIDEQLSNINDRLKRGVELDYEKVQVRIIEDLKKRQDKNKPLETELPPELFNAFVGYILYKNMDYKGHDLQKALGLPDSDENPQLFFTKLKSLTGPQSDSLVYFNLVNSFSNIMSEQRSSFVIRKLAECFKVPIAEFIEEQNVVRRKREENAEKRVADLLQQKSALKKAAPKVAANVKKIASGAKKVASGAKKSAKKSASKNKVA